MYTNSLVAERDFYYELLRAQPGSLVVDPHDLRRFNNIRYTRGTSAKCPVCQSGLICTDVWVWEEDSGRFKHGHRKDIQWCTSCGKVFDTDAIYQDIFLNIPRKKYQHLWTPAGRVVARINDEPIPFYVREGEFERPHWLTDQDDFQIRVIDIDTWKFNPGDKLTCSIDMQGVESDWYVDHGSDEYEAYDYFERGNTLVIVTHFDNWDDLPDATEPSGEKFYSFSGGFGWHEIVSRKVHENPYQQIRSRYLTTAIAWGIETENLDIEYKSSKVVHGGF